MGWQSGHLHAVFPFILVLAKKSFNLGLCAQSGANSVGWREEVNLFFCTLLSNSTLIHEINTHGLSDNVSYCILRGWRSVLIAPQPEAISDVLLLVLSLQCHSLPPGVYSTVLNVTNSLRYSQPHAGHLLASFCGKSLWGRMPWELQPSGLPACELARPIVLSRVLARSSSQTNHP